MSLKDKMRVHYPNTWRRLQIIRNRANRFFHPVVFGELAVEPISRKMGLDRGEAIDRYYIDHFLKVNRKYITGDLLEIADKRYSEKFSYGDCRYHIMTYDKEAAAQNMDFVYGDLTDFSCLSKEVADCFICTQTLNFIYDVHAAVRGIYEMLKNGGVALVTVAGISQLSPYDDKRWGDYWRFTDQSMKRAFDDVFGSKNVKVYVYGNLMSCMAYLQGLSVEDFPSLEELKKTDRNYPCIIGVRAVRKGENRN